MAPGKQVYTLVVRVLLLGLLFFPSVSFAQKQIRAKKHHAEMEFAFRTFCEGYETADSAKFFSHLHPVIFSSGQTRGEFMRSVRAQQKEEAENGYILSFQFTPPDRIYLSGGEYRAIAEVVFDRTKPALQEPIDHVVGSALLFSADKGRTWKLILLNLGTMEEFLEPFFRQLRNEGFPVPEH